MTRFTDAIARRPKFKRGLVVDLFAGGGGVSSGFKLATGRSPDIAINHDPEAVAMHAINHPETRHYCESVWDVNPQKATKGLPLALLWGSPDCTHHSKARGGKPVKKNIRGLAWVIAKWAAITSPNLIILENVEEFQDWGPVIAKRCKDTGRVVRSDGSVAAPGEHTPYHEQYLIPDSKRRGQYFRRFVGLLRKMGYEVDWRELRACDYGSPTIRKRFFLIARRDGRPITWPAQTHGDPALLPVRSGKLRPWRTAAEIVDFSLPCPSIFISQNEAKQLGLKVKRPLAPKSLQRIVRGVQRFVLETDTPFVVNFQNENASHDRGDHPLAVAYLMREFGCSVGQTLDAPAPTVMATGAGKTKLVVSWMTKMKGTNTGSAADTPLHTIAAGGGHHAVTYAHLVSFMGRDKGYPLDRPLNTITAKDRFGLVTTTVGGEPYVITDIGMRMLTPRELYRAHGFDDSYVIDVGAGRRELPGKSQVRMCGNGVPLHPVAALVRANFREIRIPMPIEVQGDLLEAV